MFVPLRPTPAATPGGQSSTVALASGHLVFTFFSRTHWRLGCTRTLRLTRLYMMLHAPTDGCSDAEGPPSTVALTQPHRPRS